MILGSPVDAIGLGFELTAVVVFAWASVQYERFIKLWYWWGRLPYRREIVWGFRILFGACLVGGTWDFSAKVVAASLSPSDYLWLAAVALALTAALIEFMKMADRRHQRRIADRAKS